MKNKKWYRRRKRLFEILEIGYDLDPVSRGYDFFSVFAILLNITASIMYTYDNLQLQYGAFSCGLRRLLWHILQSIICFVCLQ